MDTSRVDGVKASLHDGTPRSYRLEVEEHVNETRHEIGHVESEEQLDDCSGHKVVLTVAGARDSRSYERPRGLDNDAGQGEAGEAREGQLHRRLHGAPHRGVLVLGEGGAQS